MPDGDRRTRRETSQKRKAPKRRRKTPHTAHREARHRGARTPGRGAARGARPAAPGGAAGPLARRRRRAGAAHGGAAPRAIADMGYLRLYLSYGAAAARRGARARTAVIRLTFMSQVRALRYATHPDPSTRPNEIATTHNDICGCNVTSQITRHEKRPSGVCDVYERHRHTLEIPLLLTHAHISDKPNTQAE